MLQPLLLPPMLLPGVHQRLWQTLCCSVKLLLLLPLVLIHFHAFLSGARGAAVAA
jgi:hypothetical protein